MAFARFTARLVNSYADRLRSFASCCGTPLFIQDEVSSQWIDVTVASLDDPKTFPPEVAMHP